MSPCLKDLIFCFWLIVKTAAKAAAELDAQVHVGDVEKRRQSDLGYKTKWYMLK